MIQTPMCPECGARPELVLEDGHVALCATDDCPVASWDTHLARETLRQGQGVTGKVALGEWPTSC